MNQLTCSKMAEQVSMMNKQDVCQHQLVKGTLNSRRVTISEGANQEQITHGAASKISHHRLHFFRVCAVTHQTV
jgi:hypothetical protein